MNDWHGFEEVVAVADTRSFAGAARRLGVSTSHVSRAVARLEDRIRAPLFARTTRVVTLTDTGRVVVEQSRRMLQDRDEILAVVGSGSEPNGEVRVTCSTYMGERFVAPIIRRFAETHRDIKIQFELTNRVIDLVAEGFDLGIRTGPVSDTRLVRVEIASRRLHVCAAPSYLDRMGRPQSVADLAGHECLVGSNSIWAFDVAGEARVIHPQGRWRCNSGAAVLDACIAGMGICQLPDFYVAQMIACGTLVPLLEDCRPRDEPVWAVYPQRRHLLPKVSVLVEQLQAELPPALVGAPAVDR